MKVVIIGAGVAGLGIGWRLRQAGADVTILERGQPAMGATWASAGMLAVAGENAEGDNPEADFARQASALWPDFARDVEAASGLEIDYRRNGALLVARDRSEVDSLIARPGAGYLTPDETRAMEPMLSPDIAGAAWAPDEAQVDSRLLGQALTRAFLRAGGTLSVNEAAIRVDVRDDDVHALHTPFHRYEADAFILSAGPWSGGLDGLPPDALPPVKPVKGEMIAVAPPPGARLPERVIWGNGVYLVPRRDRLLIGATTAEVGFDTSVTDAGTLWLSSRAIALMPSLARWEVIERWAGLRPGSPDGLPILGASSVRRLFVATGQYRNGILFAPAVAQNMSRLVLERAAGISAFDPRRFRKGQGQA
ncbi:MAG: glycine oxidase ThiO [Rhizomicrobium sp.]